MSKTVHSNWLIYSAGHSSEAICQAIRREIKVEASGLHLENFECPWVADLGYHVANWTRRYDVSHNIEIYELTFEPRGIPLDECQ